MVAPLAIVLVILLAWPLSAVDAGQVWYLLRPPEKEDGVNAPISQWEVEGAYDSSADCRKAGPPAGGFMTDSGDIKSAVLLIGQIQKWRDELKNIRSWLPRLQHAQAQGRLADAINAEWGLREYYLESRRDDLKSRFRILPPQWIEEEIKRWEASSETDPDREGLLRRFIINLESLPGRIASEQRRITYKCLPTEALPPGMLPLK